MEKSSRDAGREAGATKSSGENPKVLLRFPNREQELEMNATTTAPPAAQPKLMTAEEFVQRHGGDDVRTRKDSDMLCGADTCYFSYDRVSQCRSPARLLPVTPDMAIEVRSSSERWTQVFAKVLEYLEAGVRVVIVLDPATATASIYRPDELQQIFDNGDELTVPDLLPGFSVPVKKLFE
jgi:hypothetical protein